MSISWFFLKSCLSAAYSWANWVTSALVKFLLFFVVPIIVEAMLLEETSVQVSLILALIVRAFEQVRVRFALQNFKSWGISFIVCFVTPCKLVVMFRLVGTIALDTFCLSDSVQKYWVFPLLVILALRNAWVHVSISNNGNVAFYIEASIN